MVQSQNDSRFHVLKDTEFFISYVNNVQYLFIFEISNCNKNINI